MRKGGRGKMFETAKKYKKLKEEYDKLKKTYDDLLDSDNDLMERYLRTENQITFNKNKYENEINSLKIRIQELERENDILKKYYDLDKEPTQEQKTEMRMYNKIHELEAENIRLKHVENSFVNYINNCILSKAYYNPHHYCGNYFLGAPRFY